MMCIYVRFFFVPLKWMPYAMTGFIICLNIKSVVINEILERSWFLKIWIHKI